MRMQMISVKKFLQGLMLVILSGCVVLVCTIHFRFTGTPLGRPSTNSVITTDSNRVTCHDRQPKGSLAVHFQKLTFQELEIQFHDVVGGHWAPRNCISRSPPTAIIIPYRDRDAHLRILLNWLIPLLQYQQMNFSIFVVDQGYSAPFNRGKLLNIGFVEALKSGPFQCIIFHDADLLPEDDRIAYNCTPNSVRHLSAYVDNLAYSLPYHGLLGGVIAITPKDFQVVNGFSNEFFGWGGEDDDFFSRLKYHGVTVLRYPIEISRYKMIRHRPVQPNNNRFDLLQTSDRRFYTDGLNNLNYQITKRIKNKLFTRVHVDFYALL